MVYNGQRVGYDQRSNEVAQRGSGRSRRESYAVSP